MQEKQQIGLSGRITDLSKHSSAVDMMRFHILYVFVVIALLTSSNFAAAELADNELEQTGLEETSTNVNNTGTLDPATDQVAEDSERAATASLRAHRRNNEPKGAVAIAFAAVVGCQLAL